MALASRAVYPAGLSGLNAPGVAQSWPLPLANRLADSQIAGAFASNLLGSQACAVEAGA